jgi:hypothetical protein
MARLLYKPLGLLMGALGGVLAGAVFKRLWQLLAHEAEPPKSTEAGRSWREVIVAATMQGAVFALVKAAVDRGGASVFQKFTGVWPGEPADEAA